MQPDPSVELASDLIGAVKQNADTLGITWRLMKATVQDGTDPNAITVIMDGDRNSNPITVVSMVGPVANLARVWVMIVPPGGNYITGMVAGSGGAAYYSARQILTGTSSEVKFTNVPTGLRRLRWSYFAKCDNAVTVQLVFLRVNGDSSAAYFYEYNQAQNNAVAPISQGALSQAQGACGLVGGTSTFFYGSGIGEFQNWDNLSQVGDLAWVFNTQGLGSGLPSFTANSGGGIYNGAPPYTSVSFIPQAGNFVAGSDFQLEGWPS